MIIYMFWLRNDVTRIFKRLETSNKTNDQQKEV